MQVETNANAADSSDEIASQQLKEKQVSTIISKFFLKIDS